MEKNYEIPIGVGPADDTRLPNAVAVAPPTERFWGNALTVASFAEEVVLPEGIEEGGIDSSKTSIPNRGSASFGILLSC